MPKVDGDAAKAPGSVIHIRRAAAGGYVVTVDMCVNHHCADMEEVLNLLRTVQRPNGPVLAEQGEKKPEA